MGEDTGSAAHRSVRGTEIVAEGVVDILQLPNRADIVIHLFVLGTALHPADGVVEIEDEFQQQILVNARQVTVPQVEHRIGSAPLRIGALAVEYYIHHHVGLCIQFGIVQPDRTVTADVAGRKHETRPDRTGRCGTGHGMISPGIPRLVKGVRHCAHSIASNFIVTGIGIEFDLDLQQAGGEFIRPRWITPEPTARYVNDALFSGDFLPQPTVIGTSPRPPDGGMISVTIAVAAPVFPTGSTPTGGMAVRVAPCPMVHIVRRHLRADLKIGIVEEIGRLQYAV